ncbi:MAG TPA: hypothetical protein PKN70_13615 [Smithellaceae bacterium]|jgi:hypothetical protein|nr:hypothetical protein [Smithellaceae bacterium]HQM46544.1 hypothetical protein [Smithellaceae bacterium]
MNRAEKYTPAEIRHAGWEALKDKLGIAGALKFISQYEIGEGDYAKLRRDLYQKEEVQDLLSKMKR